jgi:ferredoxin
MSETVSIVCFSGTGGAQRVAQAFAASLARRGHLVNPIALDSSSHIAHAPNEVSLLGASSSVILVFAVHAFDAPEPVYRWLETATGDSKRTAVISVSGGGEAWPNTGCRENVICALTEKGFSVTYEKMMVMPCNWVFSVTDDVAMHLLAAVPAKTEKILDRFLSGSTRRTGHRQSWLRRTISTLEKRGARQFPRKIRVTERCNACLWCVRHCPVNNIACSEGKPRFGGACVMCFRCVYGCPKGAIAANDFQVLKKGFDLCAVERRMTGKSLPPVETCCQGLLWAGVRRYLNDEDGY